MCGNLAAEREDGLTEDVGAGEAAEASWAGVARRVSDKQHQKTYATRSLGHAYILDCPVLP